MVLDAIATSTTILDKLIRVLPLLQDYRQKAKRDTLRKALQDLFFFPDGFLSVLDDIKSGKRITTARLNALKIVYKDIPKEIRDSFGLLMDNNTMRQLNLTLGERFILNCVKSKKISIRNSAAIVIEDFARTGNVSS